MKTKLVIAIAIIGLALTLTGCATKNPLQGVPLASTGQVYGFLSGIWDGLTIFFALVGKIFGGNYGLYQVHNDGLPYDVGYVIGLLTIFGRVFRFTITYRKR